MNKASFISKVLFLAIGVFLLSACSEADDEGVKTEVYSCSYMDVTPGGISSEEDFSIRDFIKGVPFSEEEMVDEERKYRVTTYNNLYFTLAISGKNAILEVSNNKKTSTDYKIYKRTKLTYTEGEYIFPYGTIVITSSEIMVKYTRQDDTHTTRFKLDNYQYIERTKTDKIVNRITHETTTDKYSCDDGSLRFSSGEYEYIAEPMGNGYLLKQTKPEQHEYELEKK